MAYIKVTVIVDGEQDNHFREWTVLPNVGDRVALSHNTHAVVGHRVFGNTVYSEEFSAEYQQHVVLFCRLRR